MTSTRVVIEVSSSPERASPERRRAKPVRVTVDVPQGDAQASSSDEIEDAEWEAVKKEPEDKGKVKVTKSKRVQSASSWEDVGEDYAPPPRPAVVRKDFNLATRYDIMALHGFGSSTADVLVASQPYRSWEAVIDRVHGVAEGKVKELRKRFFIDERP